MELALIGLGKMGLNMATRLVRGGHRVVGYARSKESVEAAIQNGADGAYSLEEAVGKLTSSPKVVWVMVPAGTTTTETIEKVAALLKPGDIIIDGGNTNYKDTIKHAETLTAKGIDFVDCGTSGGIWGLTEGYSLMIGGKEEVTAKLNPIFETLAPGKELGWGRVGPHGAGHYVKMVHNGIEYGMMQAFAEGFGILKGKKEFGLDLAQVSHIWQHGSVVRSWLLDLAANALDEDTDLKEIKPWVADSGEGRWTVFESIDLDVPAPVITLALQMRFASRDEENYPARMLAALRNQFGGHAIKKA
ncbi:MAG TPA: decarboxylating 6-phosphogluconate dehydrogenase [Anaerolineales bacterium]|jgi:6-phosphogluconate dehydrogenase|nr:decarboxylating 6-phosphogluconate dehydrogenase [Anaerolineae bacterium]HRJ58056.1 decarboxylating 6-phosphogluconate dehydrogenase [Anaerolineales bacterium]HRK90941.1 decarboxylating 6-phosphogluconate dehydrogenase [Anaerolineales bacterium]